MPPPGSVPRSFAGRSYVSGMLSRATRSITVGLGRRLSEAGLSFAEYLVLVRLWRAWPATLVQSQLAVDLGVERSSMSTLLSSLEQRGLVARSPDPDDGRRLHVYLTDRGRALEPAVLRIVDEYEGELVKGMSAEQLEVLRHDLEQIQAYALMLRSAGAAEKGSQRTMSQ